MDARTLRTTRPGDIPVPTMFNRPQLRMDRLQFLNNRKIHGQAGNIAANSGPRNMMICECSPPWRLIHWRMPSG